MRQAAWIAAAFVTGLIVSAVGTRVHAETELVPAWVIPGACAIVPSVGTEVVLEVQGVWIKTKRDQEGEIWRNLQATPWVKRLSEEACAQRR